MTTAGRVAARRLAIEAGLNAATELAEALRVYHCAVQEILRRLLEQIDELAVLAAAAEETRESGELRFVQADLGLTSKN